MKSELEIILREVLCSVTSGYKMSFTVLFDCNLELFAAERNVEALNCNLWYCSISLQVSLFNTLSVAPESIERSILRCGGEVFWDDRVFFVCIS